MDKTASRHVSSCRVDIPARLKARLFAHLFPGDGDEHGAVLAASIVHSGGRARLLVRHVMLAEEGIDYVRGLKGYRLLRAEFVQRCLSFCREQHLAYIAVHNHGGSDHVEFSGVDLASHERGYPALLDLMQGLPVGALVFARHAAAGDIWWTAAHRTPTTEVRVVGHTIERLRAQPWSLTVDSDHAEDSYARQILLFGEAGQAMLKDATVGVIGAGGAGSLINEYLARLGVGRIIVADPDRVETSNLSRIVGATRADARGAGRKKVLVARRVAKAANPSVEYASLSHSVVSDKTARRFIECDFVFLAADTASARLVFNALVHQYYLPGIQVGAKVRADRATGVLLNAFSVMRWVLPGLGCLWCSGLISPHRLAWEAKTDKERQGQRYGTESSDPSVITLNAVAASHAVNEFLFAFTNMRTQTDTSIGGSMWEHISQRASVDGYSSSLECSECSDHVGSRFGRGDGTPLPTSLDFRDRRT
jgi:hypothetical protein